MLRATGLMALVLALLAGPAIAAPKPSPSPSPKAAGKALPIKGVTVDVQPIELAPGVPATAPEGAHVEQLPAWAPFRSVPLGGANTEPLRGFSAPKARAKAAPKPSPSPSRKP